MKREPSRGGLGYRGLELRELRLERSDVPRGRHGTLEGFVLCLLGASRVGRAAVVGVVEADDLLVGGDAEEAGELEDEPEGDLRGDKEKFFFCALMLDSGSLFRSLSLSLSLHSKFQSPKNSKKNSSLPCWPAPTRRPRSRTRPARPAAFRAPPHPSRTAPRRGGRGRPRGRRSRTSCRRASRPRTDRRR